MIDPERKQSEKWAHFPGDCVYIATRRCRPNAYPSAALSPGARQVRPLQVDNRTTLSNVRIHLRLRRFHAPMRAALCELAANPDASYRETARAFEIDLACLYNAAKTVPGLAEMRRAKPHAEASEPRQ